MTANNLRQSHYLCLKARHDYSKDILMNDLSTGFLANGGGISAVTIANAISTIDQRLENWSRYYRHRTTSQCCGSVEGKRYHAPWRQWVPLSEVQHSNPIDWQDAEEVERAWKKMLGRSKLILKYVYMATFPDHIVCRKVGIKRWQLESEIRKAKQAIYKVLDANY
jgi:hypothetical protein